MKRRFVFVAVALLTVVFFLSGCAKKTVLQEEKAVAPAPAKVEKAAPPVKPAEKAPKAAKKKEVKEEAPAPAPAVKEEAPAPKEVVKKAKKAKEAEAPAKVEKAKKAAPAAVPAKELYEFADIHFDFDKFNLRDEARATLDKHAAWLNKNRNVNITVEGHCDERGTAEYNLALGQRRADAAAKYLTDMGVEQSRIKTISYGEERPQDSGHNEEAWAKNRRAHLIVNGGR